MRGEERKKREWAWERSGIYSKRDVRVKKWRVKKGDGEIENKTQKYKYLKAI